MVTTSIFLSVPTPPSTKLLPFSSSKQLSFTNNKCSSSFPLTHGHHFSEFHPFLCSSSSTPSAPLVEEQDKEVVANGSTEDVLPDSLNQESSPVLPPGACKGCGKVEIESGCNGEGRIQGGIATVPGFGWWPIKAYRPCPAFVASGGRYRRFGQSMDEVVSGRGGRDSSAGTDAVAKSSKKKKGPAK